MYSVWISKQVANFYLHNIHMLDFITEAESVRSAVRTESLYNSRYFSSYKKLNQIYRGTNLTYFKQVKMQRMKTANTNTSALATRLDADTTYCYASGLLPRLQYTFLTDALPSTIHCPLLKSMHLTFGLGSVPLTIATTAGKENIQILSNIQFSTTALPSFGCEHLLGVAFTSRKSCVCTALTT